MPHPSPPSPARRTWRIVAALVVAVGLVLGGIVLGDAITSGSGLGSGSIGITKSAAAAVRADGSGDPEADAEKPSLTAAPLTPVLESGASDYEFSVLIANPGEQPVPGGTVTLEVDARPLDKQSDSVDSFPATATLLAEAEVGETGAASEQVLTLSVPHDDLPSEMLTTPGVFQFQAKLSVAADAAEPTEDAGENDTTGDDAGSAPSVAEGGLLTDVVPLVWRGTADATRVDLSIIVPLVLPDEIVTLPTRAQLDEVSPRLDRLLTAAEKHNATLAIDPRIIAGIRAFGDEAPASSRELLSRLETSSLPSFLLQFADADPAAQAALGFTTLLEPTNLDFLTRFGAFTAEETPEPDPATDTDPAEDTTADGDPAPASTEKPASPAPHSDEQDGTEQSSAEQDSAELEGDANSTTEPRPSLEQLLDWPQGTGWAWPAEGEVNQQTVDLLRASGYSTIVLDSSNVSLTGGPRATLDSGTPVESEGESDTAIVTESSLAAAASAAASAPTETEQSAALADLATQLALAAQSDSSGIILGLDRGTVANAESPELVLDALDALGWVSDTAIADQSQGTATLKSADTLEERRELLRTAANREGTVAALGTILVHPEYLSGYQRTRLLELFATRHAHPGADFSETAVQFRERDAELLEGVRAISTEHTQLVGASTRVPLQLRNLLPFDALVRVQVDPASAALSVPERVFADLVIPADGNETVLVPVHSRLSSGESGLVVGITDASGAHTVFTGTVSLSIRSAVETIALWTIGVLAALLLGFGIWRSIRRKRHPAMAEVDDPAMVTASGE